MPQAPHNVKVTLVGQHQAMASAVLQGWPWASALVYQQRSSAPGAAAAEGVQQLQGWAYRRRRGRGCLIWTWARGGHPAAELPAELPSPLRQRRCRDTCFGHWREVQHLGCPWLVMMDLLCMAAHCFRLETADGLRAAPDCPLLRRVARGAMWVLSVWPYPSLAPAACKSRRQLQRWRWCLCTAAARDGRQGAACLRRCAQHLRRPQPVPPRTLRQRCS